MKINQLPSKTWYWLGLNDTKVKWAAGAPCEICAEEPSADDEITGFPEAMNTGAGKETDVLFAPEQTKKLECLCKRRGRRNRSRFPSDREREGFIRKDPRGGRERSFPYRFRGI
ncbi:MAG: hypothetical protein ACLRIL_02115 [Fusicatenibacter saccharivorans]